MSLFNGTNTTPIGTAVVVNGTWSITPTVALGDGPHTLTATQTDSNNAISAASTGLTLTIDTTAPAVTEALVNDTGSSNNDHITNNAALSGTGAANAVVTLTEGTTALGSTTANTTGAWTFTPTLSNGAHSIVASETNIAGNTSTASLTFTLNTTAPAVTEALTSDTGTSSSDNITNNPALSGAGVANAVVTLTEGTTVLGSTTADSTGAWTFTPTLSDGAHTIVASETDAAGNTGTATRALVLNTAIPTVTAALAANPHNTASMVYNQVLNGGGDPNASVTIRDGNVVVGTAVADATGAWSLDLAGLAAGSHSLIASETDAAGNTGASAAVPLTVASAVVPDTRFTLATGSTATSGKFFGSDYTGAATGHLQAQYGYVGTANVSVIANVANTFIYGGAGNDAIVAKAGSNVLDGAGGSNWMIGASGTDGGTDTFFVDNRSSQTTWNTLLNFHVGDMLTVWDFSPAAGSINFADNLGQPGYTGLTLEAGLGAGTTDLATFAGLSSSTAHLVTSTGASGGLSYLAVTRVA